MKGKTLRKRHLLERPVFIFDLFHTLTGPEADWSNTPWTHEVLGVRQDIWIEALLNRSRERLCGMIRDPFTIMRTLADLCVPGLPDDTIREAVRLRQERFGNAIIRIPERNLETLKKLKAAGKKLGLLSNADSMEIARWNESPAAPFFDSTIFSCDAGFAKPEPEIFKLALEELDARGEETVFIGDGGSKELRGAREAGMGTVLMTGRIRELWPERIPARRPWADLEIEELPELLEKK